MRPAWAWVAALLVSSLALVPPARAWPRGLRLPPRQTWSLPPSEVGGRRFVARSFDGHVHTHHSRDARLDPLDVLELAEHVGLDALVLTDHGSRGATRELATYEGPVTVLMGEEVGGRFGHALVWNTARHDGIQAATESMRELGALAHSQGGLAVLAHPGWWMSGRTWDPRRWMHPQALARGGIAADVDALELWNDVYQRPTRALLDEWARLLDDGLFVPVVGNSDFHSSGVHRLGTPRNVFLCPASPDRPEEPSTDVGECLVSAVRAGRLYVTSGPTLSLDVGGRTFGEALRVRAGARVPVRIEAQAPEGGTLDLYVGSRLVSSFDLPAGRTAFLEAHAVAPRSDNGVRVEIRRPARSPRDPEVSLVSNPVMLDLPPHQPGFRGPDRGPLDPPEGYRRERLTRRQLDGTLTDP